MLGHLCHEIVVVKEEEADHGDDEESSASGLRKTTEMQITHFDSFISLGVKITHAFLSTIV